MGWRWLGVRHNEGRAGALVGIQDRLHLLLNKTPCTHVARLLLYPHYVGGVRKRDRSSLNCSAGNG